jgi:Co/Zn/Cd efflux system component
LIGAAANWGVAHVLREPSKEDMAIRLAYVHNLGDTMVSLVPVAAGILVFPSGNSLFDSLFALLIAARIVITTLQAHTRSSFAGKRFMRPFGNRTRRVTKIRAQLFKLDRRIGG